MNKAFTKNYWTYWPAGVRTTLTLTPKAASSTTVDADGTAVSCPTCRKLQPTREQLVQANIIAVDEVCVWEIWDRDQGTFPLPGDRLTDTDSIDWNVRTVRKAVYENLYICVCVREL